MDKSANKSPAPTKAEAMPLHDTPTDKKAVSTEQKSKPNATPWWKMVLEAVAVLVGIYVAFIYSRQLTQMIESNKISRESLTSVQRAFVTFNTVQYTRFVNPDANGQQWQFNGELINNGTTPAIQAVQRFVVDELPNGLSEETFTGDFSEQKANVGTVGPKATYTVGPALKSDQFVFMGQKIDLEHPERARAIQIEKHIYFWGWAAYRDIFRNTPLHLTEFCAVLNGMSINRTKQVQLYFSKCPVHNCTDEYCSDYETIKRGLAKQ
jgi:hypothetical protein